MNIDEVLLNEWETSKARNQFTLDYKRSIAQNKAQCLKLLEWHKKEHPDCLCMSELESKLKEG